MALVLFKPARLLLVVLLGTFSFAQISLAALPCGNIINDAEVTPITDCEDPFEVDSPTYPHTLKINEEVVLPSAEILVPETGTSDYVITPATNVFDLQSKFYLHDGDDYRLVPSGITGPEETDYYTAATEFFPEGFDSDPYVLFLLGDYSGADEEGFDFDLLEDFETYMNEHFPAVNVPLLPGTYTLVSEEILIILNYKQSIFQKVRELFMPTAYAQTFPKGPIYTLTFTLKPEMPVPTGASSVLFLPGIMGSRLYEESAECGSEVEEQERWFSTDTCDHLRLQTDFTGSSLNDLYTLPSENAIVDETFGLNLYKTFLAELADWKEEDIIDDYAAVPYDWRLQLDKILKTTLVEGKVTYDVGSNYKDSYLYQKLEDLVENSKSGKVTIVTHSNGGMVAKVLLQTMKINNDPLLSKVDNLILVGVPQSGTPEAVVGMLHGSALGPMGFALSQETSRKLMINMPFAHHLLPNEDYFDAVDTPVITFAEGSTTDAWREEFGGEIQDQETLQNFLRKESGRIVPADSDLATPAVVDGYLFDYNDVIQSLLHNWEPEPDTKVYQIAGTGIETPSAIEYFTDQSCVERNPLLFFKCVRYEPKLGYRVGHVIDGDGTVVVPSAQELSETENIEKFWLDLKKYAKTEFIKRVHKDIFEIEEVQDFISSVVASSSFNSYFYLATSAPEFSDENRLLFRLHSPLDLYVVLHDGEIVGSSTPLLRGVEYRRYGEVQQLSIPEDEKNYEIRLVGQADGSFTLDIDQYRSEELEERVTYSALPSSTSTNVVITLEDDQLLSEVSLLIDYDGDGVFETSALPGLGQVTFNVPDVVATSTPPGSKKSSSTGTKVKERVLAVASPGLLTVGTVAYETSEQALLLQIIEFLTQYRDLLIKLRLQ